MQKQIKHNVVGAPFRIGKLVRVVKATDETFEEEFMGKVGIVIYYDYKHCGQTYPNDPMIGVRFSERKSSVFWREELAAF